MLTLQQMIDGVLAGAEGQALSKIAQAADEMDESAEAQGESKAPSRKSKDEAEREAEKEEKAQGGGQDNPESEDTDRDRVEKMASAIEEVVRVLLQGDQSSVGRIVTAMEGAPENATQMPTNVKQQAESAPSNFGEARAKIPTHPAQEKVLQENAPAAMATNEAAQAKQAALADVLAQNPKSPELKGAFSRYQKATGKDPSSMSFGDIHKYVGKERGAKAKTGSLQEYVAAMHQKYAEDNAKTNIRASKSAVLPEDRPLNAPLAAGAEGQRAMLASNEAALNLTKRKAKALSKQDLAALLSEKALTRSTDKALDQTLGAQVVDQAGAKIASERKLKIAAARALISKIASEGCTCEQEGLEKGECKFCRVASRLDSKSGASEKEAQNGSVPGASNVPSTVEPSPAGGNPMM
jgi:hypothetical protein